MGLSTIQWCDWTYNPWAGCRKVAPECVNCYIPTTVPLRTRHMTHGPERIRFSEATLSAPRRWNKKAICGHCGFAEMIGSDDCRKCGQPFSSATRRRPRVFCLSLGDWLDDENVPIEWLADLLKLIHDTPNLDWLLLTKRPQNFFARLSAAYESRRGTPESWMMRAWLMSITGNSGDEDQPPANVWIGVSAGADQAAALAIPARIHFLSCEPMLHALVATCATRFSWIIFGGESGSNARPMDINWIRRGVEMCRKSEIAPFVKQLGKKPYEGKEGGFYWPLFLKDSHGGDMNEWPDDLKVREFPTP